MPTPAETYRRWLEERARRLRAEDTPPRTPEEARARAVRIRARIREAVADAFPARGEAVPLDPQLRGTLERDGYRVERLLFQTQPGVYATATAYVPTAGRPPFPAVLCVHGHWAGARRDPVVQARCIGLAKLGFFALTLDAWGAGERGTRPGENEYHGGLLGASLWPVATPLYGLQLWDNMRALDYLQSRPEVDGTRIGCTGASGGGNQTTHLSAFDERVKCAVPVCSVGTFASYLTAACCVDEVLPEALTFAEEGDLLGMVAPRALLVISATRDSYHFGPEAAREALERARPWFRAHGAEERVRHAVFESGHDYNRPMREAMYGWMRRWLQGAGDGSPVPEPEIRTEDMEALRCFPPPFRPARVMTTVRWVAERSAALAQAVRLEPARWAEQREEMRAHLRRRLRLPEAAGPPEWEPEPEPTGPTAGGSLRRLRTEPGIVVPVRSAPPEEGAVGRPVLLLHPEGAARALDMPLARALRARRLPVHALELRGCGELVLPGQGLGDRIPDHTLVEWGLWVGRPLLGQWVHDIRQAAAALGGRSGCAVVGWREAGFAALLAAGLEERIAATGALEMPATFVTGGAPHGVRMVLFLPNLLKVGDVPHLAALAAPRRLFVADPVRLEGAGCSRAEVERLFAEPRRLYRALGHPERFRVAVGPGDAEVAAFLAE